jgi:eukaryotic-like serine/threonine-protein kinase
MNPEAWERVKEVFHSALDRDPAERVTFLDLACRGDAELRAEVDSLLARAGDGSFLERAAWEPAGASDDEAAFLPSASPDDAAPQAEHDPPRRHPFVWAVWLTTAIVVVASGYAAWRHRQDGPVFGWSEARRAGLWQVASVTAGGPAAGRLLAGDILLSLNGDRAVSRGGTLPYRRVLAARASYRLDVVRAGKTLTFTLAAGGRPRGTAAGFVTGLVWVAVGLFIGFARPQDAVARLAFVACTLTGLSFLGVVRVVSIYALKPVHVLGYHFFYLFPREPPRGRGWSTWLRVLYLATIVCVAGGLLANWLLFARGPQALTPLMAGVFGRPLEWLLTATASASLLGAAAVAGHKYRAVTDSDQRRRFYWVALGGITGLGPVAVWVALDLARQHPAVGGWLPGDTAWALISRAANVSSIALPLAVAYAVAKHRVFDARIAIRRGFQYLLARRALQVLLALPIGASLFTLVTERHRTLIELVTDTSAYLYWIAALAASLRFRAPLLRWLDRKFFREQYDREQVLLSLADEFGRFDSAEEISSFVCRQLGRSLHPKSVRLWRREAGVMQPAGISGSSPGRFRFPLSERLLEALNRLGPAVAVPLPAEAAASDSESRWLAAENVRVIATVAGANGVEAVLMLGEKRSEDRYIDGDIQLIRAVAQQTAVVLDNLHLKGQVRDEQRIRHEVLSKLEPGVVTLLRECPDCGACYDGGAALCERDGHALTLSLPVSRTLDGKYRLDRLIGRGGMGAVYAAHDLRLVREVAVKVMVGGPLGRDTALRRFRREARVVAGLSHPNIVALHDFGELDGGGAYLVMERIHGPSLRAEMRRVGVFTVAEVAEWFDQLLEGLAAAHERGIVHRDLKPENILAARRTTGALAVKILDFGLAKMKPLGEPATSSLTESGVVLGTLAYMAPEQLAGEDVDRRADIFAAGVILAEMLTGRRPISDGASLRGEYRLPPGIPNHEALDRVLARSLARSPNDRFLLATDQRAALLSALRA